MRGYRRHLVYKSTEKINQLNDITTTTKYHAGSVAPRKNATDPAEKRSTALSIGENQDGSVKLTTGKFELEQLFYNIKLSNAITTIGTWNVRTLRRYGKINELTNELERYQWNIIGLSETRLTGYSEILTEAGHTLYYSGQSKHFEGVGFIIKKDFTKSIMNYSAVSSRIMSIRIRLTP